MFERMQIEESIYEGVVSTSYIKLVRQKPTVLDSVGKREEKASHKIITSRRMRALASAVNDM